MENEPGRKDDFLPDHQEAGEAKGKLTVYGLIALILFGAGLLILRCAVPIVQARHQGLENFKQVMQRVDSQRLEMAKAPPPPVPDPLQKQIEWEDETGGLLVTACGFANARDFRECPPQERIQVRWLGGRTERRLVVVRGFAPVETLLARAETNHWARLCTRKDKDVVLLSQGDDPCSARRLRAWSWGKDRMKSVSVEGLDCDTSTCSRYRERGSWPSSSPAPDSSRR